MNKITTRLLAVLLAVVFVIGCAPFTVFAADDVDVRQADITLPDVSVEVQGKYAEADVKSVKIGSEELKIKKVIPSKEADKTLVYVLVDISTSMSQSALNALKPELIKFAKSLGDDDKFVLMTFGTEIKTVLKGGESDKKVEGAINALRCNSEGTTFYRAITKSFDDSLKQKDFDRKYAIIVSDGADFEKGQSSQEEVLEKIQTNRLPYYGMCLASAATSSANGFGYLVRESGGELVKFSGNNAKKQFDSLKKIIADVTIIKASGNSRKSLGRQELEIKLAEGKKATETVFVKAVKDDKAPTIEEFSFEKSTNSFIIKFSENVDNADNNSSYKIKKGDKELTVLSVNYNEKEHSVAVNMDKKVYSGTYTFELENIVDASDNQNPLDKSSYEEKIKATPIILKVLVIVAIALVPVLFLLALYLILLNLKKKKNVEKIKDIFVTQVNEVEEEHIHIEQPKGRAVVLYINAGDGKQHTVNYNLVTSMIVGRSEISDLSVEDVNMSRQHFVIEDLENGLAVTDLQTTNGTFVNGIKINSRTFVDSGSKIMAGNSVITISY